MSPVYYFVAIATAMLAYFAQNNAYGSGRVVALENGEMRTRPAKGISIVLCAILVLVAALRFGVGTDYFAYYRRYTGGWSGVWVALLNFDEPGFAFLSLIGQLFSNSNAAGIFVAASLTIALYVSQIYKYSPMFTVSMLLYLFVGEWHGCFNGVRQYLAAAIIFAGHRYIYDRKFWKYTLIVFIASLFHTTALVMILPYFLLRNKPDWKKILIMAIAAIVLRYSYDLVFDAVGFYKGKEVNLNDGYITREVNLLRIAVNFVPVIVYVLLCDKNNHTQEEDFYINYMLLNAFTMAATMGSTYLARAGIYTAAYTVIGYGYLFRLIKDNRIAKITVICALVLFAGYWWYSISTSSSLRVFRWIFEN